MEEWAPVFGFIRDKAGIAFVVLLILLVVWLVVEVFLGYVRVYFRKDDEDK